MTIGLKSFGGVLAVAVGLALALMAGPAPAWAAAWVAASGGAIPRGAVAYGVEQEPGGEPLFACRAFYAGAGKDPGLHPGKIRPAFGGCNIGYGGAEVTVPAYEVLVGRVDWVGARGGGIPDGALRAGHEGNDDGGQTLFLCRARYPADSAGVHPGKVRPGLGACHLGWGGRERLVRHYEVAVTPW